jgi:DNA-3-methyladenine glycosylase
MTQQLGRGFFNRPTKEVAKELLGKYLIREIGKSHLIGKIVEVEAYIGEEDLACHAAHGKTKRNRIMWEIGGKVYVYLNYGIHFMLNVVTEDKGKPAAVLIRAVEPIEGVPEMGLNRFGRKELTVREKLNLTSGPGKLTRALLIDQKLYGEDLTQSNQMWLEDWGEKADQVVATKRIGVDYAGKWKDKPWRFYIKKNLYVSKK